MINLKQYFYLIQNINYGLTKIDVPYMSNNFPEDYPIGKDLDIFVSNEDYDNLIELTKIYFKQYEKEFKILEIKNKNNYRLRLEEKKKLHYQIDITKEFDNILNNKEKKENFFKLSLENEKKIRLIEIKKNPKKKHHIDWLKKYTFL